MICENCNNTHDGLYGSGRFCSVKCARGFSTKNKRKEINEMVSLKLKRPSKTRICKCCSKELETHSKSRVCSESCRFKLKSIAAKKGRLTAKERGTLKGWKARTLQPSYPEKYFIDLFDNENITDYVRELPVGKWFIDFAFIDKKLAIEIDGKQHEYAERKLKDIEKDNFLSDAGWTVFRIKWKNPVNESNKLFLYSQIEVMKEYFSVRC